MTAMAPTRRLRIQDDASDSDDTHPDSDATPRQGTRNPIRKRLSEGHIADNSNGRLPLNPVSINDDDSERRRRRKSTKLPAQENSLAGPSSETADPDASIANNSKSNPPKLNSVVPPPDIQVPRDVMNSNFEEWMKMATDNKINAANSWNFALIDYFHDMSLLRNVTDNTINFQRASCTLDGCVKIWTNRVDSVGTETGKLLSNLANEPDSDGEVSDNPDGTPRDPSQPRKKKAHRTGSTLAKDPSQLRSKKLDLDFSVDPLFKKTCGDFDEGGAQGLLMNHLSLGFGQESSMRVIFDAGDSTGKVEEEDEFEEVEDLVDISYLRSEFLPDLSILEDKTIAPSLEDFSFAGNSDETFHVADAATYDDDDDDFGGPADNHADGAMDIDEPPQEQDFFAGDQGGNDDFEAEFGNAGNDGYEGDEQEQAAPGGPFVPFDPRQGGEQSDLMMGMGGGDGPDGLFTQFDQGFSKNWAGPEHWKRKPIRRLDARVEGDKPKAKREKKEAFKIDFLTPSDKDLKTLQKELFAPAKPNTIKLPKPKGGKAKKSDNRLPDDMHFTSKQLVTLFLKPKFSLKMRGRQVKYNENGDGEVDQNFWAQAATDPTAEGAGDDGSTHPFNTQFLNDDDDDDGLGGFDIDFGVSIPPALESTEEGEQDLLAATQGQTKRVRPETVNYTKRAKRVDVRRLKENIWKGLKMKEKKEETEDVDMDNVQEADEEHPRMFGSVIGDLERAYQPEKMAEISTSFCFICLLHLANEQGLKIEGETIDLTTSNEEADPGPGKKERVGNIWDLKVSRDPDLEDT